MRAKALARWRSPSAELGSVLWVAAQDLIHVVPEHRSREALLDPREQRLRVAKPPVDAGLRLDRRRTTIEKRAEGVAIGVERGSIHRRAVPGDEHLEVLLRQPIERRAPMGRARGVEKGCR